MKNEKRKDERGFCFPTDRQTFEIVGLHLRLKMHNFAQNCWHAINQLTLFLMGCFRSLRHKLYNSSTIEILKKNWVLALEGIHVTKCRV